jgi:threonine dehydrogenase-like Zn-dependent dehydrogenase
VKALTIDRKMPRFAAARVAGTFAPGAGAKWGPLSLDDVDPPARPGDEWVTIAPRLAGICGSDLATIDGMAARYFEPIVSFPFTPGHEVVADTADGRRVVIEPVLGCVTRGIDPPCRSCALGDLGNCERLAFGCIDPGLQSGFCSDTGGGWSTEMVAHPSQLHAVPDDFSDEAAVMVEPTACAVHGALRAPIVDNATVAVIGAGTLGLLTVAALRAFTNDGTIVVGARYPQQVRFATEFAADRRGRECYVVPPSELGRVVRSVTGSMAYGRQLTGGADVAIDCVGDASSIEQALNVVRPRGHVVLIGMPATVKIELTSLWHRETQLLGAYAYGTETLADGTRRRTFDLAFDLVRSADLGRLVSATYPLTKFEFAISHAANAGRRGAVKVAFDMRSERKR